MPAELLHQYAALQPLDEHNQRLADQVHPAGWTNPQPSGRYNLVVVGAGTAGLVAAAGAAGLGAKVALIERELMGGDCLNVGCVPSKALLSAARAAAAVRRAGEFGVQVPPDTRVAFDRVMQRMRRLRASISPHDSAQRFRQLGVDVFFGQARFEDGTTLSVGSQRLRFRRAVIATGARPAPPPIPGLQQIDYLTNETVFSLTELPQRLAIVGAGPIGCELAQCFARFGAQVTLIETEHGVLPREDREAAAVVEQALRSDGVQLLCCGRELQVGRDAAATRLQVVSHGTQHVLHVDRLLVAAGRTANVEELNLDAAGVRYEARRGVQVNDRLQTSNARIFAAGDVCSRYQFTHAADHMARIVVQNALFFGRRKLSSLHIPWCTYTSPELAHVGITPQRAEQQSIGLQTFVQPLAQIDRAIIDGQNEGFAKIHVRPGKDRVLGATIVADNAGDLISQMALAMQHGLGLEQFANTVYPYPTQAEAIRKIGDQYNRTRLTPARRRWLGRWLGWWR